MLEIVKNGISCLCNRSGFLSNSWILICIYSQATVSLLFVIRLVIFVHQHMYCVLIDSSNHLCTQCLYLILLNAVTGGWLGVTLAIGKGAVRVGDTHVCLVVTRSLCKLCLFGGVASAVLFFF